MGTEIASHAQGPGLISSTAIITIIIINFKNKGCGYSSRQSTFLAHVKPQV